MRVAPSALKGSWTPAFAGEQSSSHGPLATHCGDYGWRYAEVMAAARWTNLICGMLLVVVALAFLVFLPGDTANYGQEPEDVWLGRIWTGLLGLLAALCFANARQSNRRPRFGWRTLSNSIAVIALAVLLFFGRHDPAVPPLLGLCALGPLTALLGTWLDSHVQQP